MNYKSTVKNMKAYTNSGSPDAFTYEMIDNIYVKFLIHISKLHRGCISKQSKKGMGKIVHEIEDDMEFVEAYSDIIPKDYSKYLSPEQRRSIVFKAHVRKKCRSRFDEKQYAPVSQWIPKEVAEILTKKETR